MKRCRKLGSLDVSRVGVQNGENGLEGRALRRRKPRSPSLTQTRGCDWSSPLFFYTHCY